MDKTSTISWIFFAVALASEKSPVSFNEISNVADGINHAVPNHKEIQDSISWLLSKKLVLKTSKKYELSELGKKIIINARTESNLILDIWKKLDIELLKLN